MADITKVGDNNASFTEGEILAHQQQQDDALITENKDLAPTENPLVSAEQDSQSNETDWEKSAKYFQSEKDKLFAENEKIRKDLEKYQSLGQYVESDPDIQQYISQKLNGETPTGEPEQISPPEDFDPWEAYNNPSSASYQFRSEMEQRNINNAVKSSTKQMENKMQLQNKMQEFDNELSQQGLDANEKQAFYNFANTPLTELGTDTLVRMWKSTDSSVNTPQNASGPREFEAARRAQAEPTSIGILQGEQPPKPNQDDAMWDRIVSATNRTKVI